MINIKKKLIVFTSIGMIVTTFNLGEKKIVNAAESEASIKASAKILKTIQSINDNYAGIKNQIQWEEYINEGKWFVSQMPLSEYYKASEYNNKLNDLQKTVIAIARINHVEKSYEVNYKGIKNAEQWRTYLNLAKCDMENIDRTVFETKYDELLYRYNDIEEKVRAIEDEHNEAILEIQERFNRAKVSEDMVEVEAVLAEISKLGTHETSEKLKEDIEDFLRSFDTKNYQNIFKVQEKLAIAKISKKLSDAESVLDEVDKFCLTEESIKIKNETKNLIELIKQGKEDEYSDISNFEREVVRLINIERAKVGREALILDTMLSSIARFKTHDMVYNDYFGHISPEYGNPTQMAQTFGINYGVGENIAKGHTSPEEVVCAWMNSEGHKDNILSENYEKIGVGYFERDGVCCWSQMFTGEKYKYN